MKLMYNNQGAYYGRNMGRWLWGAGKPGLDPTEPFYVESRGETMNVSIKKVNSSAPTIPIEYSFDKTTWQSLGSTFTAALTINIPAGGKVWLRANTDRWATSGGGYNHIITSTQSNVGGNIMSLLYGDTFTGQYEFPSTTPTNIFYDLFRNSTYDAGNIVDASKLLLPATTLADSCYQYMFYGCTSLTTAPTLPATTLADSCYDGMFYGCTSLTTAPTLPATTLADSCYQYMFHGCTSLTQAPTLPATTLAEFCYEGMFWGCTSLTAAPELPATTLAEFCYEGMFRGCTSLTAAPELPATTLVSYCYRYLFHNCTNLNYIKCLGTDIFASNCTANWVSGVSSTGTFVKKAGVSWDTGTSGIPSGWTVEEVE